MTDLQPTTPDHELAEPCELGELTDDALTARVRVLQRRRGHRYSLDDVATAWVALTSWPHAVLPRTCLDLGCGLGSVLLMLADRLPEARLVGVEAQAISHGLVLRNIERNGFSERVRAVRADLRDEALLGSLRPDGGFELITGTPPYKPLGTATPSPDSQRAHARVELRGGIEAYLLAASRVLAANGRVVVCCESEANPRAEQSAARAGLHRLAQLDVVPMQARKGHLFSVHVLGHEPSAAGVLTLPPLVARDEHGARTEASRELRRFFGLDINADEAPSPALRVRARARAGGS